jgi:hypothetical protein
VPEALSSAPRTIKQTTNKNLSLIKRAPKEKVCMLHVGGVSHSRIPAFGSVFADVRLLDSFSALFA